MNPVDALDRLTEALLGEREALVALDGEALRVAGESKLAALDAISACLGEGTPPMGLEEPLRRAFDMHQANAELLHRRRQETSWLLKMLGAVAPATAYDSSGDRRDAAVTRRIAEA